MLNELARDNKLTLTAVKNNLDSLRRLAVTLESVQQEIEQDGMHRQLAEVLECQCAGVVTKRLHLNGFTQHPSRVGQQVAMEALSDLRNNSFKALLVTLITAAVAVIGGFITYLFKQFRGRSADARRERGKNKSWALFDVSNVGVSRPQWRTDPEYLAAVEAYEASLNVVLLKTGSGQYRALFEDVFRGKPKSIFSVLTEHVDKAIAAILETTRDLRGSDAVHDTARDNPTVLSKLTAMSTAIQKQYDLLERVVTPGFPGSGPLSRRVLAKRQSIEDDLGRAGITRESSLDELYGYIQTVLEAINNVEGYRVEALTAEMQASAKTLQSTLDNLDFTFGAGTDKASDLLVDAAFHIQRMLEIQADIISILSTLLGNVLTADEAYCTMLKEQLAAMERVGIRFNGNEAEFAEDRKFYKQARAFLD